MDFTVSTSDVTKHIGLQGKKIERIVGLEKELREYEVTNETEKTSLILQLVYSITVVIRIILC